MKASETIRPARWKILLAFSIIYFVWGSTFLAIRIGVHEVPPFLLAGMRFFIAGLVLFAWMRASGTPSLTRREWTSATLLGTVVFVLDYGSLFWAERRVPSGIAAVVLASIPVFMTLSGNYFPAHATPDHPFGNCSGGRNSRCRGVDESFVKFRRSANRSNWRTSAAYRCHELVGRFRAYHSSSSAGRPSQ